MMTSKESNIRKKNLFNPSAPEIKTPDLKQPEITYNMTENMLTLTRGGILSAISDIKNYSAAGPNEPLAILLKRCAQSMSEPIQLLWQESFRKGVVPDFYKKSLICPLYKKEIELKQNITDQFP